MMEESIRKTHIIEKSSLAIMEEIHRDEAFFKLKDTLQKGIYDEAQIENFFEDWFRRLIEEGAEMSAKRMDQKEYCLCVMEAIFEAVCRAYPGGESYDQFVRELLKSDGIELSEDDIKREIKAFEIEMSKVNKAQTTFAEQIAVYRTHHTGKKEEFFYRAVMPFERAELICRFYLRKRNASNVKDRIEQVRDRRLWPLASHGDPAYFESKVNWTNFCVDYKKFGKKAYFEMNYDDMQWMDRFVVLQEEIMGQEEDPLYYMIGLWYIRNKFQYMNVIRARMIHELNVEDLQVIADVIVKTIFELTGGCEDIREMNQKIWDTVLKMANTMADKSVSLGWQKEVDYEIDFGDVRYIWREMIRGQKRLFDPEMACEKIRGNIVNPLQKTEYDFQKRKTERIFIELSLCCAGIPLQNLQMDRLCRVFQIIFDFLDQCREIKVNEGEIRIVSELKILRNKLAKENIAVSDLYDPILREERSNPPSNISDYFEDCYSVRYKRVWQVLQMMRKEIADGKNKCLELMPEEFIINKYLDLILMKKGSYWRVPQDLLNSDLERMILPAIIQKVFPAHMTDQADKQYYAIRDRIIEIAHKCDFARHIGF